MITIGRLANYAGVTIKAIRHYHERGLLAEPDRDSSGYRRYTAQDAIDLVKIRTLADAGVPLARIKDLLDADPDTLTAAIAEIDHDLRQAHRAAAASPRSARPTARWRPAFRLPGSRRLPRRAARTRRQRTPSTPGTRRLDPPAISLTRGRGQVDHRKTRPHDRSRIPRHLPRTRRRLRLVAGRSPPARPRGPYPELVRQPPRPIRDPASAQPGARPVRRAVPARFLVPGLGPPRPTHTGLGSMMRPTGPCWPPVL